ncbi:hypothetical protein [Flavivirga sp. 57AJ16]|uniref:hypothetical protein n=1 Tax=Flavivirga sp. 57AJ16 TaxID=3025307 RepID=UPI00236643F8|nr:hypothetical protein [Flavivirga sp. 57AJ16]MDD7885066.1 hypothetical protein [Flavivirga sp. 57AJ16]
MTIRKINILKISLILAVIFLLASCGKKQEEYKHINKISFNQNLSEYNLFKKNMSELIPNEGVIEYKLNATLFTDYALKQRLVKIPLEKKIEISKEETLNFPEGTIIAKTFYYENKSAIKNIIETRLLIKSNKVWNVGVYQWDNEQKDATLIKEGATVNITTTLADNIHKEINYKIPSLADCIMCHKQGNEIVPIGPKLRNLVTPINHDGVTQNQIDYFPDENLLVSASLDSIKPMVDYNKNYSLNDRARSYFDINCSHCHNPNGIANMYNFNLSYTTPFYKTGIMDYSNHITFRMGAKGPVHMPKIGTTVTHKEGYRLIKQYIDSLYNNYNKK